MNDVTRILRSATGEGTETANELFTLVYDELRRLARLQMGEERRDHTLQATALANEAYLRLVGAEEVQWRSRAHFFYAAGRAMRQILVEHARSRARLKRGGGEGARRRAPIGKLDLAAESDPLEILALDEAFCRLEKEEPEAADVVRLRFFAGLSGDETAAALGISPRQVDRLWAFARAWLFRALQGDAPSAPRER